MEILIQFGESPSAKQSAAMEPRVDRMPASDPSIVLEEVECHLCLPNLEPMMEAKESPTARRKRGPAILSTANLEASDDEVERRANPHPMRR